jgi:zinc protease
MVTGVPASGKSAAALEAALRAQLKRVADEGISAAELKRVVNQWTAGEVYQQDSVFNQARRLGVNWTMGLPLGFEADMLERLRRVTPAQVQAVAARYFGDDELTVATLLPQSPGVKRKPRTPSPGARH